MDPNLQKADKAIKLMHAMGVESAQVGRLGITISVEDAMKLLLLTDEDHQKFLDGERRIRAGIKSEVKDLKARMARLVKLANHSPQLCKKGEHITESYPTGGRSGHCVTRCLACDYRVDGYD